MHPSWLATPGSRRTRRVWSTGGRLREALELRLAARSAADWAAALTSAGVPARVVNDIAGAFRLATSLGLAPLVSLPREDGTSVELTRNPIGLSTTPPSYRWPPPGLDACRVECPPAPPSLENGQQ